MITFDFSRLKFSSKAHHARYYGIDLSGTTLKIVSFKNANNKIEALSVESHSIIGLGDDDIVSLLRGALKEASAQASAGGSPQVTMVIPSYLAITKNIEIPSVNPQEIREIINLQAGRHTPYSRDEIIIDYIDLGVYKSSYTKVLLVIVAKAAIKKQYELLERLGISPLRVCFAPEVMAAAASKVLKLQGPPDAVNALVHIDEQFTDFTVMGKGKPLFVRSIPIGFKHLTDEGRKYDEKFSLEIKNSLESYQNEDIDRPVTGVVVTGAIEGLMSLQPVLAETLKCAVRMAEYAETFFISNEAFTSMAVVKHVSFYEVMAPVLVMDVLRINLVPEEVKLKQMLEERGKELIKSGILVMIIFALFFFILITKIYFASVYLHKLDSRYAPVHAEATRLEGDFAKIGMIKQNLARRGFSLEVLTELYNTSSDSLQLSDIRFDEQGKFTVRGTAESMSAVFSFVENLGKSKYFKDVKTKYTTKRKEGLVDVTDFEVNATLVRKGE